MSVPTINNWFGAKPAGEGVDYRVWAPGRKTIAAVIERQDGQESELELTAGENHVFEGHDASGQIGDLYQWRIDGEGPFPDPASHFQPRGVHDKSEVIDHDFRWRHSRRIVDPRQLIIYEMHIGTFTTQGTFEAAAAQLPELQKLGVTAIEVMPVADFPGDRNWGYDGVMLYAPSRAYGRPEEFKRFVDMAHGLGLVVILDVVYNHFGPDGNYLWALAGNGFFRDDRKTPWGDAINYDGEHGQPVRDFFLGNIAHWMAHYRIDGFRLDATHEIRDESERHLLAEIAALVREQEGWVVAEDDRNEHLLCLPESKGGLGLSAVWADDFHHVVRVALTGQRESYFGNYHGTAEELAAVLDGGWLYRGQKLLTSETPRGTDPAPLDPAQFVHCISNHDQTGNRAFGERLHHLIEAEAYDVAQALLLLSPFTPMLFMGDEWGCSSPFLFFSDHSETLGKQVTAGRRREFGKFKEFADPKVRSKIPDPQADETYRKSQLHWEELNEPSHQERVDRTRELLTLRRKLHDSFPVERGDWEVTRQGEHTVVLHYHRENQTPLAIWCALQGQGEIPAPEGAVLFKAGTVTFDDSEAGRRLRFKGPFLLLLKNHGALPANPAS